VEGKVNLSSTFFVWWYTELRRSFFAYLKKLVVYLTDLFSVKICLITLFAPWKRDKLGYEGLSIQQRFQVLVLNLSSRFVGFMVKVITLLTWIISLAVVSALELIGVIIWLFYPLILIALAVWGIKLIILG